MKEVIREYGQTVLSVIGAFGIVKLLETFFLGTNGMVEILFKLYT